MKPQNKKHQNRANKLYLFRREVYNSHRGPILFPEIIKNLPIEEIRGWAINESNYKIFYYTISFLGLGFDSISEDDRNPKNETFTEKIINSYKHILNDNVRFNALFDKFMEMKRAIDEGVINTQSIIYDEESDDDTA
jgi:hypothetical protein